LDDYLYMISLKTSVLLAASLEMGAILGGAGGGNRQHLYDFGKTLALRFKSRMIIWMHLVTRKNLAMDVGGDIRQK